MLLLALPRHAFDPSSLAFNKHSIRWSQLPLQLLVHLHTKKSILIFVPNNTHNLDNTKQRWQDFVYPINVVYIVELSIVWYTE